MQFEIVTLFPELFDSPLKVSLIGKAVEEGLVRVHFTDPRDFAQGKHRQVDDTPYGGGPGMVMKPEPLVDAIESACAARGPAWKVLLSPQGRPLDQKIVRELASKERVLLVCGRYEGMDERVRSVCDDEISIGDFVLAGGEAAAFVIVEAVSRLVPGVLGAAASVEEESFSEGLLEYPQYTRPLDFRGMRVPEILTSGNHEQIRLWRRRQQLVRTLERRPELFEQLKLSQEDQRLIKEGSGPKAGN